MATHGKTFRFLMKPTADQAACLCRQGMARRWVWNWGLERRKAHYAETGKSISTTTLAAELTAMKKRPETAWLKETDAQALQQALRDLDRAFTGFFTKRAKLPKFKSRKRDLLRFRIPQRIRVVNGKVYVPKAGWVRIRQSQPIDLKTESAAFKQDASGRWFVYLIAEFEMPDVPLPPPDPAKVVGIDVGLIDFITTSDGQSVPAPRFYRNAERKLKRAQRAIDRKQKESNRREDARKRFARLHQKVKNKRADFIHKLTTDLVRKYDAICIETLSLTGLVRTKLAKSFADASLGEFRRQLEYKCVWNRKHCVVNDRWSPSSKTCYECKASNDALTLDDRKWTCPTCGAALRRDLNAARNIRDEGMRTLAAGYAESQNARGRTVRPAKAG